MIRRSAAVVAWVMVAAMDAAMFWTLTAGGFLGRMPQAPADISDAMVLLTYAAIASIVAVTLAYASAGVVLALRAGAARVGAVLLAGGLVFAAIPFGYVVGGTLVLNDPYDPIGNAVFLIGPASIALGYALILPVLALVFPHGSLPTRRWRGPTAIVGAALVAGTLITVFRPGEIAGTPSRNPFGIEIMPSTLGDVGNLLTGLGIVAVSLLGATAVVVRYRRGSSVERQQLRWFLAAVLLAIVPIALSPQESIGGPIWVLVAAVGLLLVPVSVGIAVTRYRLYEIDRIISRTLAYGIVTLTLVVVFATGVLGLQAILAPVTGENTAAVAASTLIVAALFQPLRRRTQSAVDRRFDRARFDGERTAAAFAARLRDQVDLENLEAELGEVVRRTVAPTTLGLWIQRQEAHK